MINVEIEPDQAGGYVLRVRDGDNKEILLSSTSQSYANAVDAEKVARRLFERQYGGREPEPVELRTTYRDGTHGIELIR